MNSLFASHRAVKFSLALAFFAAAAALIFNLLYFFYDFPFPSYLYLLLYLPAVMLGIPPWLQSRTFLNATPLLGCIALMLAGIAWADPSEQGTALFYAAGTAIILPIAALIISSGSLHFCISVFLFSSLGMIAIILFLTYHNIGNLVGQSLGNVEIYRLGSLINKEGQYITGPNGLGFQMCLAALLALILDLRQAARGQPRPLLARYFFRGLAILFSLCVLLSVSRAAIAALLGCGLVLLAGQGRLGPGRKLFYFLVPLALGAILLGIYSKYFLYSPAEVLTERLYHEDTTSSLGGRLDIWQAAREAIRDNPYRLLFGSGTEGTPKLLAAYMSTYSGSALGQDGIWRISAHNTFLDWFMSFGLIGSILGLWLWKKIAVSAWLLDREEKAGNRTALLMFVFVFSMTGILFRAEFFPGLGSLFLTALATRSSGGPEPGGESLA